MTSSSFPMTPLTEVAHSQSNELWDVVALLDGVVAIAGDDSPEIKRLTRMARELVRGVQDALNPYI